jgi:hypothetical protein
LETLGDKVPRCSAGCTAADDLDEGRPTVVAVTDARLGPTGTLSGVATWMKVKVKVLDALGLLRLKRRGPGPVAEGRALSQRRAGQRAVRQAQRR